MNRCPVVDQNHRDMRTLSFPILLLVLLLGFIVLPPAIGIPITSSKGKTVDFSGVKSASPAGLEVQVKKDGPTMTLPWSRLDLKKLETENPKIHEARKKSLGGEKVELNLGSFVAKKAMEEKPNDRKGILAAMGIYETSLKGKASDNFAQMGMALKVPGGKAKGIFLYISGAAAKNLESDDHFAAGLFDTTPTAVANQGPWFSYAEEHGLAIAGISVDSLTGSKKRGGSLL